MAKQWYKDVPISEARLELIDYCNGVIEEYQAMGYDLTLRQLFYQLVARAVIENTENSYKRISSLLTDGRLLGLVDWDAIVDRTRGVESLNHFSDIEEALSNLRHWYHLDKWADQDDRVEVWVEKEAAIGIVARTCNRLDVPYFATRGYSSVTAMRDAAQRLIGYYDGEHSQYPVVIYLGDHDPSGMDMGRDIVDRLELFMDGVPLQFTRLALNMDQIMRYDPPPNPTKFKDSRAKKYNEQFGYEGWELDALSPDVVDELITREVDAYRDVSKWEAILEKEDDAKRSLSLTRQLWPEVEELVKGRAAPPEGFYGN